MQTRLFLKKLGRVYPRRLAEAWDHVGHQAGALPPEVRRVLLCLDFDSEVLEKAFSFKSDLIISHHPFFFGKPKDILAYDGHKAELLRFIEEQGLCLYSYHTNFDKASGGMNDVLAEFLGLSDVSVLPSEPTARGGYLPFAMNEEEFGRYAIERLGCHEGRLIGKCAHILRIAVLGGGGSSSWRAAKEEGYDAYISGDVSHSRRRDILGAGFCYLDVPHEIEEKGFIEGMGRAINKIDPTIEVESCYFELDELKHPIVVD